MRNFKSKILLLLLLLPLVASAVTLDAAKGDGLVGETSKGYLAAVNASPSADVKALISEVNAKRRAQYERIAKQNGISVEDVEKVAGQKAIDKTPAGQFVKNQGGGWKAK
jgi:uncharacterized protein YdbL (DUF1318 family)